MNPINCSGEIVLPFADHFNAWYPAPPYPEPHGVNRGSSQTLLYGVETKLYNNEVAVDKNLETKYKGLFIIGDGSGVTHSLVQSSASGLYVGECINGRMDGNIQL